MFLLRSNLTKNSSFIGWLFYLIMPIFCSSEGDYGESQANADM